MRSAKARPQLESLIVQLSGWEASVPDSARRFHALRRELSQEIQGTLPFWQLWIGDEVLLRHRERVDRLGVLTQPLAALIRDAGMLEAEVRRLAEAAPSEDTELPEWLRRRCRDWVAVLGRLGANCERETDLSSDQAAYAEIESAVRLLREAIHQLEEATRIMTTLGADVRAAGLAGSLPQLRQRLYSEGATPEWIEEIKRLMQPLRSVAERVQDPPRELSEVGVILTELRGWSALLGDDEHVRRGIEQLETRRFKIADWAPQEAQELVAEAQSLRLELLGRVERLRSEKLTEMEQGLADLRQACGDQPELDARLAALASRQSNRPQLFRDWLAHFDKVRHTFKAVAQAQIAVLETRLIERRERIARGVEELEAGPLSDDARREAVLLAQDLRALPQAASVEEILLQLRTVNELARKSDQLARRAERELEEVARQQRTLTAAHEILQSELQRIKDVSLDLSGFATAIAALSDGAEGSLEDRRQQAARLSVEMEALQLEFVVRCRAQFDSHVRDMQHASAVLRHAGATLPIAEIPDIPAGASPREAADAVLAARRGQHALLRLARATRDELEARRVRARADLMILRLDDLGPADRQTAEQLLREVDTDAKSEKQPLLATIESLARLVAACDRFFETLLQEQRSARERLAELHRRFRIYSDEQLARFCPELSARVAALIYGVPEHPRQWSAVHHQLDCAAELLGRIETHAQRLAADELERAAEVLRVRLRNGGEASFRDSAQSLLAELDTYGFETLAPAALRQRVLTASQRQG